MLRKEILGKGQKMVHNVYFLGITLNNVWSFQGFILLYLPAFKGLLCLDLTGTPDPDLSEVTNDFEMASDVHVTTRFVDSLVDDVVGDMISSVGASVVVVEFVVW